MPTIAEALAHNLRRLREARGLSQAQLAALVGAGETSISRYENGTGGATLATLKKLATALRVQETELVRSPEVAAEHGIEECARRVGAAAMMLDSLNRAFESYQAGDKPGAGEAAKARVWALLEAARKKLA